MLEALAAATILATRWDRCSAFVNPMCGSGTLAIEAALIATNRRPGLFRQNYAFMHFVGYDRAIHDRERAALRDQIVAAPNLQMLASDISAEAVEIARTNAAAAGVADRIQFSVCDFEMTEVPPNQPGIVMFNPEYGERLGDETGLEATYKRIGDFMKQKCSGYTGYVFTGNLDLAKKIGLRTKRRIQFSTAKLDCRLLEFELYKGREEGRKEKA
jgi:putative N6-adenine-specific DNA methylase